MMQSPPPLSHTPTNRDTFALAWPLAMKAAMLHGIVAIDAYLVSPLGESALAALGLSGAIIGLLLGVIFAFSNATQIRIAQASGTAGLTQLKTAFYCGLAINIFVALVGGILVWLIGPRVLASFAQTVDIETQALAYLSIVLWVAASEAVGQCLTSQFNGIGRTRIPFLSYLLALPVNVIFSYVLIHGYGPFPALGVAGAAWGTLIGSVVRLIYLAWMHGVETGGYVNTKGWTRATFAEALSRHLKFSWPIAVTFVSVVAGNQACVLIYAKMDLNAFAAMTIMLPWVHVVGIFGMSWAQATGILIAQLLGRAASIVEIDTFLSGAWRIAFVAAGLVATTYLLFCLNAAGIYTELEAKTITIVVSFLPILLLLPFPKGSNAICGQSLRAAGDTVRVMNIFVSSQWLFKVPLTAILVFILDAPVFWVFAVILFEELYKFPLFHSRMLKGDWKTNRPDL